MPVDQRSGAGGPGARAGGNVGHVQDSTWQAAIDAGWSDAELTESSAVVALDLFTNSFDHLVGTELDLPAAPSL